MAVCWSAAISWGYNLPILFATPWLFGVGQWFLFFEKNRSGDTVQSLYLQQKIARPLLYTALVLLFFYAAQFIYRDGRRSEMMYAGGDIFPALSGIQMDAASVNKYRELKLLAEKYPNFATLPAFPQAHLLTRSYPALPLDWVVQREMNAAQAQVREAFYRQKPVLLVEKKYLEEIKIHKEYTLIREILDRAEPLGEHQFFILYQVRE